MWVVSIKCCVSHWLVKQLRSNPTITHSEHSLNFSITSSIARSNRTKKLPKLLFIFFSCLKTPKRRERERERPSASYLLTLIFCFVLLHQKGKKQKKFLKMVRLMFAAGLLAFILQVLQSVQAYPEIRSIKVRAFNFFHKYFLLDWWRNLCCIFWPALGCCKLQTLVEISFLMLFDAKMKKNE